jgi:hypothetical protein
MCACDCAACRSHGDLGPVIAARYAADPPASPPRRVGVKDDRGKARWDLLPLDAVEGIVDVLTYGASKYAPEGWRSVPDAGDRYLAALLRHLAAWRGGERLDQESGLPHLAHVACNAVFLVWLDGRPAVAP